MSSIVLSPGATGAAAFTIEAPSTATSRVITLPDATDTLVGKATTDTLTNKTLTAPTITGASITVAASAAPAFSAYRSSTAQSITTSTWTKVQYQTEEFDTNSNYDNATNYRFTPTVAGYYQFIGGFNITVSATTLGIGFYKNGTAFKYAQLGNLSYGASCQPNGTAIISLNGSTDYVEMYVYCVGTSPTITADAAYSFFQASMIRSA